MAAFAGITLLAWRLGDVHGPAIAAAIPIAGTLWGAAELLTAFLLLTQFSVNGVRAFLVLGGAYAVSGLLTIPYVAFFPGAGLMPSLGHGPDQISAYFWLTWHCSFPILIAAYFLVDRRLTARVVVSEEIRASLWLTCLAILGATLGVSALIVADHAALPPILSHGRFTAIWSREFSPLVVALNLLAALVLIVFARRASKLQVWVTVALMTAAFDGILNALSHGRYSLTWYLGKFETIMTATIVLAMLLAEVSALYRRLGTMAMIDSLTGLRNRRAFDDYVAWALARRARVAEPMAFLIIDVDYFKEYNDRYGHNAGDTCLRRLADTFAASMHREYDVAARIGGEEFAVMLPDTAPAEALVVAERVRRGVEALAMNHSGSAVYPFVTVSIGVANVAADETIDATTLFGQADRALYTAKERRNAVAVLGNAADRIDAVPAPAPGRTAAA